jgi:hypothetical protein
LWAVLTGTRFTDLDALSIETVPVQFSNRGSGVLGSGHGDKSESPGFTRSPICDQIDIGDRTFLGKQILQLVFGDMGWEISDK